MNTRSKTTEVPKLSYLHVSKLKKPNRNREKLFNFWNVVLLKGSTSHLNDKKLSDIGTLNSSNITLLILNKNHKINYVKGLRFSVTVTPFQPLSITKVFQIG